MPRTDAYEVYKDGKLISSTPIQVTDQEIYLETIEAQTKAGPLARLTPDQAEAWIDANVTTLAGARTALKLLARLAIAMRDRSRQPADLLP